MGALAADLGVLRTSGSLIIAADQRRGLTQEGTWAIKPVRR
jgi:hypothetical protein